MYNLVQLLVLRLDVKVSGALPSLPRCDVSEMLCWGWNRYGQCAVEGEDAVTAARSAGDMYSNYPTFIVNPRAATYTTQVSASIGYSANLCPGDNRFTS